MLYKMKVKFLHAFSALMLLSDDKKGINPVRPCGSYPKMFICETIGDGKLRETG